MGNHRSRARGARQPIKAAQMKIDLDRGQLAFLQAEVSAKLFTYIGYDAQGRLLPKEKAKLAWLRKLSAKLERAA